MDIEWVVSKHYSARTGQAIRVKDLDEPYRQMLLEADTKDERIKELELIERGHDRMLKEDWDTVKALKSDLSKANKQVKELEEDDLFSTEQMNKMAEKMEELSQQTALWRKEWESVSEIARVLKLKLEIANSALETLVEQKYGDGTPITEAIQCGSLACNALNAMDEVTKGEKS